ncbi:hypothetical protein PMAYCL1PPCAC_04516, partial [Pristionchus mayeri]
ARRSSRISSWRTSRRRASTECVRRTRTAAARLRRSTNGRFPRSPALSARSLPSTASSTFPSTLRTTSRGYQSGSDVWSPRSCPRNRSRRRLIDYGTNSMSGCASMTPLGSPPIPRSKIVSRCLDEYHVVVMQVID